MILFAFMILFESLKNITTGMVYYSYHGYSALAHLFWSFMGYIRYPKTINGNPDDQKPVLLCPKGLPNIGNTCFSNVIIQSLNWTPNLHRILKDICASGTEDCQLTFAMLSVLDQLKDNKATVDHQRKSLKALFKAIRNINKQFKEFHQQDSYEMFNTIINGMDEEMEKLSESGRHRYKVSVRQLFEGCFITTYRYLGCGHVDVYFQKFTSINVQIVEMSPVPMIKSGHFYETPNTIGSQLHSNHPLTDPTQHSEYRAEPNIGEHTSTTTYSVDTDKNKDVPDETRDQSMSNDDIPDESHDQSNWNQSKTDRSPDKFHEHLDTEPILNGNAITTINTVECDSNQDTRSRTRYQSQSNLDITEKQSESDQNISGETLDESGEYGDALQTLDEISLTTTNTVESDSNQDDTDESLDGSDQYVDAEDTLDDSSIITINTADSNQDITDDLREQFDAEKSISNENRSQWDSNLAAEPTLCESIDTSSNNCDGTHTAKSNEIADVDTVMGEDRKDNTMNKLFVSTIGDNCTSKPYINDKNHSPSTWKIRRSLESHSIVQMENVDNWGSISIIEQSVIEDSDGETVYGQERTKTSENLDTRYTNRNNNKKQYVTEKQHTDVEEGLQSLLKKDNNNTNAFTCKRCPNIETICSTTMEILIPPPILILHITKVELPTDGCLQKLRTGVTYPEYIDLDKLDIFNKETYKILSNKSPNAVFNTNYRLYSVVCHRGTMNAGHYYAYIRKTTDNDKLYELTKGNVFKKEDMDRVESLIQSGISKENCTCVQVEDLRSDKCDKCDWFKFIDFSVCQTNENEALKSDCACMLFYEMIPVQ